MTLRGAAKEPNGVEISGERHYRKPGHGSAGNEQLNNLESRQGRHTTRTMRLWLKIVIVVLLAPGLRLSAHAQSDEMPLGDLARSLRKNQAPPKTIIDNDNLPDVMEDGETRKWALTGMHFSLGQDVIQMVNASSPDVTCALSFNAKTADPLAELKPQSLPDAELAKLDGPAAIVNDSLQVSVYNGSGWDLREITVGLTIVRRAAPATAFGNGPLRLIPAAVNTPTSEEKHSDITVLYHLKGTAAPLTTTVFRETLNAPLAPDQEWHWAILQAKGIPPAPPAPATTEPQPH